MKERELKGQELKLSDYALKPSIGAGSRVAMLDSIGGAENILNCIKYCAPIMLQIQTEICELHVDLR
jgi:hypothetical protein